MIRGGFRTAVVALAALALLSSCGGDDADTGRSDDTTTTTASPAAASTTVPLPSKTGGEPLGRYAGYQSVSYADDAHWLCRPDRADACSGDLSTTTVTGVAATADPSVVVTSEPPVDCFYVYPTISRDPGVISDWDAAPDQEGWVALNQAAPLRNGCRVFAPIYRQRTLASIATRISGAGEAPGAEPADPYVDVLDAWKTYMANDNDGRGVVLIGHSQGAGLLTRLIQEEFDGDDDADVRPLLVSAYLAGSAVAVPAGKDVGGAFTNVPLCRSEEQAGCVVTWASFRSTAPPPATSFFGRAREGTDPAGCTNPAALGGGSADADAMFPTNRSGSILAALPPDAPDAAPWIDPAAGKVSTPFVKVPGLVSVECVSKDGFDYLEVTVHGDPADPRADDIGGDLTPEWGLHLVDTNLVTGDIQRDIAAQWLAWTAEQ